MLDNVNSTVYVLVNENYVFFMNPVVKRCDM
jgi:hypothetical protein